MKSPTAYFLLGFAAATVIWLVVLAFLNAELLRTFTSFSGHS
jgi:arginine exporter protein ArgO